MKLNEPKAIYLSDLLKGQMLMTKSECTGCPKNMTSKAISFVGLNNIAKSMSSVIFS